MPRTWPKILPKRDYVNVRCARILHSHKQLVVRFSETDHQTRLCFKFWIVELGGAAVLKIADGGQVPLAAQLIKALQTPC